MTEHLPEAAAANTNCNAEMFEFVLARWGAEAKVTDAVVKVVVTAGDGRLEALFNLRDHEVKISDDVVLAAAEHRRLSHRLMELLFQRRGPGDLVETLLAERGNGWVAEEILEAAVEKKADDGVREIGIFFEESQIREALGVFFEKTDVKATPRMIQVAGQDQGRGHEVVVLLLENLPPDELSGAVLEGVLLGESGLPIVDTLPVTVLRIQSVALKVGHIAVASRRAAYRRVS
ncbi:hypothetical protein B0T26DRAFT_755164 [Lasiosphaeria miniovina]|uniref:Uncharacterized protein n=1 Tax=Lasiosphaeria miniovina TaxID=1954250 RepID=A0AA40DS77_9PEZI|nr:uncharacterized protein B0T26DRAFT_755164 [Lasiosphaeria miniovina]KAK0710043.1 hypothetical protein B0T26DRAFT_755164 [Lasiosphaeria miniovina]